MYIVVPFPYTRHRQEKRLGEKHCLSTVPRHKSKEKKNRKLVVFSIYMYIYVEMRRNKIRLNLHFIRVYITFENNIRNSLALVYACYATSPCIVYEDIYYNNAVRKMS